MDPMGDGDGSKSISLTSLACCHSEASANF